MLLWFINIVQAKQIFLCKISSRCNSPVTMRKLFNIYISAATENDIVNNRIDSKNQTIIL